MIKVKILIVDDEKDFCLIMKNYFNSKGFEVLLAFCLQDGLNLIKEEKPDVLFLDNKLPHGEGWNSTYAIVKENPSLKINLVSAYKEKTNEFNSFSNVNILGKPISIKELEKIFAFSA